MAGGPVQLGADAVEGRGGDDPLDLGRRRLERVGRGRPQIDPQLAPLPPDNPPVAAEKPADPKPAEPAPPPVPTGPLEVKVAATQTTVKLVSPGKGKRVPLRLTPKAGAKQLTGVAAFDIAATSSDERAPAITFGGTRHLVAWETSTSATGVDIRAALDKLTRSGLEVMAGLIVGERHRRPSAGPGPALRSRRRSG